MMIGQAAGAVVTSAWGISYVAIAAGIVAQTVTINERVAWILTAGGAVVVLGGRVLDMVLPRLTKFKRELVQIEDGSHKGRADECEEREKRLKEEIRRLDERNDRDDRLIGDLYMMVGNANANVDRFQRAESDAVDAYRKLQSVHLETLEMCERHARIAVSGPPSLTLNTPSASVVVSPAPVPDHSGEAR